MRAGRETNFRDRRSAGACPGGGYSPGSSLSSMRPSRRSEQQVSSSPHSYQMHQISNVNPPTQLAGSLGSANSNDGGANNGGAGIGNNIGLSTNVAYLSPPLDSSWRRTHSDSSLHQAAMASAEILIANNSPNMTRRGTPSPIEPKSITTLLFSFSGMDGTNYLHSTDPNNHSAHLGLGVPMDGRPKSCCDVSRVPGIKYSMLFFPQNHEAFRAFLFSISIVPGPEPNGIQIPIGNNTGSLPDLTNLQFASPLPNPIDGDDGSFQSLNVYSTVRLFSHFKAALTVLNIITLNRVQA